LNSLKLALHKIPFPVHDLDLPSRIDYHLADVLLIMIYNCGKIRLDSIFPILVLKNENGGLL